MYRRVQNLALLAMFLFIFGGTASVSQAAVMSFGLYQSLSSGHCIDVEGGRIVEGTRLVIFKCHGESNQRFNHGVDGLWSLGKLCVGTANPSNPRQGDAIVLRNCYYQDSQGKLTTVKWFQDTKGSISTVLGGSLLSRARYCVDISGASRNERAPLILWGCHGGSNQRWIGGELLGAAYVFVRWDTPGFLGINLGHVGWGFKRPDYGPLSLNGYFFGGTVDGTPAYLSSEAEYKNAFSYNWNSYKFGSEQVLVKMFSGGETRMPGKSGAIFNKYHAYKIIPVVSPNWNNWNRMVTAAARYINSGYFGIGFNCLDQTYSLLREYGALIEGFNIQPPTDWFRVLNSRSNSIPNNWFLRITNAGLKYVP